MISSKPIGKKTLVHHSELTDLHLSKGMVATSSFPEIIGNHLLQGALHTSNFY